MAEGCDRIPLIADDSSTDIFVRRELDVQQYESYKADNDDGRFVIVGVDVDIEKAGSSADGGDRTELIGEAEGNKLELGEASNADSQQSAKLKLIDRLRSAGDEACKTGRSTHVTAASSLNTMHSTLFVLNVGKARTSEAIASAEKTEQFDEATRNTALVNKFEAAIELVTARIKQIDGAARSAENAAAHCCLNGTPSCRLDENEAEVERKLSRTYHAINLANKAAILVNKTEYTAVKAVRKCLKDIDPELLEFEAIISQSEELAIRRKTHEIVMCCICNVVFFISGILSIAQALTQVKGIHNADNISILILGSIMTALSVVYFIYRIFMYCRNKRREALEKKNRNIITQIDKRLLELEEYFKNENISLEPEDEE